MYIPPGWHHAVVTVGETVALAVQRSGPGGLYEGGGSAAVDAAEGERKEDLR